MVLMTVMSRRLPMLASVCAPNGGVTLPPIARTTVGADLLPTRVAGHVAGVTPAAAKLPHTVLSPEQIQVQDPRGGYATKPESMNKQDKFGGLRGIPPRGRPV